MSIKSDYLLDMIERFVEAILVAVDRAHEGATGEAIADYEGVVGGVLDMDADCALELSPFSLVTMMQLSAVDEALAVYSVFALRRAAELYDADDPATASVRRSQAQALADAYGIDGDVTPAEVEEALAARSL